MYTTLRIDKANKVAEVVLNRPEKLNTMTAAFFEEIGRAFSELNEDDEVDVIVLWAEGRMFTAGLDLREAGGTVTGAGLEDKCKAEQNLHFFRLVTKWQEHFEQLRKCKKPVIAAVHNNCIGGGVDLITAADMRFCTKDATFSIKETAIGLVADLGTLQRISRVCSPGVAREMAFSAASLPAHRALRAGLVNEVYETKEQMMEAVRALAKSIASHSPLVVQGTKTVMNYADEHSAADGKLHVALWNAAFLQSDDLTEAFMAFMEKRPPKYRNRL